MTEWNISELSDDDSMPLDINKKKHIYLQARRSIVVCRQECRF